MGSFTFFPSLEIDIAHSDNINETAALQRSGEILTIRPALSFQSDWARHELRGNLDAAIEEDNGFIVRETDAELSLRLDITTRTTAEITGSYNRDPESRGDPNFPTAAVETPINETWGIVAALRHRFSRILVSLIGTYEDNRYKDVLLANGTVRDNSDREYEEIAGMLRVGLDIGGNTVPFIEAGTNNRRYRRPIDNNGVRCGSKGYEVLAGASFEFDENLSGEIGAGYQLQEPDSVALRDVDGLLVRGSIVWQPTPLTTISLNANTSADETTVDGAAGSRNYTADVTVAHALRRNLTVVGSLTYEFDNYIGSPREESEVIADAQPGAPGQPLADPARRRRSPQFQ